MEDPHCGLQCKKLDSGYLFCFINKFLLSTYYMMLKTFKIYPHSNFQIYNMVLLTVVTMLYIRSLLFIHLKTKSLYSLSNISPFSPSLSRWQ